MHKTEWTIATCNVRLLPEAVARKHNLRNTAERAKQLAVRIASSDMPHHTTPVSTVLQAFPTCDFICLQQVYDRAAVERILFYLNTHWPFILEDTGVLHWRAHRLCAGSGLMLLSKYPIMDAEFKQFPGVAGKDGRFCRGVLIAKVNLGGRRGKGRGMLGRDREKGGSVSGKGDRRMSGKDWDGLRACFYIHLEPMWK